MSNTVTAIAKRRVVGSSARKAVLMYLADSASEDGSGIWTSKRNIARDLEMSRRTVQAHIEGMTQAGILREVGQKPCVNGYTVEYAIDMASLAALPSTRDGDDRRSTRTGAADAPVQDMHGNGCSTCTPTGAADAPKPPLEPSLEPPLDIGTARKAALPPGWVPDNDGWQYALSLQLTEAEIQELADDFREYWRERRDAQARKTQRGWRQAWRNRCLDMAPRLRRARGKPAAADPALRAIAAAARAF